MEIKKSAFLTSVKWDYTDPGLPEIAIVGRSNVGKSSLINVMTHNSGLAKVSGTPGKTRLVNFFSINDAFCLVDLPGYGFAKVSKGEKDSWDRMIQGYFDSTKNLRAILVLMDIRHAPNDFDKQMLYYSQLMSIPFVLVATKADKIAKSKRIHYVKGILKELGIQYGVDAVAVSSLDGTGVGELLDVMEKYLVTEPEEEA